MRKLKSVCLVQMSRNVQPPECPEPGFIKGLLIDECDGFRDQLSPDAHAVGLTVDFSRCSKAPGSRALMIVPYPSSTIVWIAEGDGRGKSESITGAIKCCRHAASVASQSKATERKSLDRD